MGMFRITLILRESSPPYPTRTTIALREFAGSDIDSIWHKLERKCQEKWGRDLKGFDCVMISKRSAEYKEFIAAKEKSKSGVALRAVPPQPKNVRHEHPFAQEESRRNRD